MGVATRYYMPYGYLNNQRDLVFVIVIFGEGGKQFQESAEVGGRVRPDWQPTWPCTLSTTSRSARTTAPPTGERTSGRCSR